MKKKALALLLAICMVLSLFPAEVSAAQELKKVAKTAPVELEQSEGSIDALQPQASYSVHLSGGANGTTELLVENPVASGDVVAFSADPDDGYLAEISVSGIDPNNIYYQGGEVYAFYMPAKSVTIRVQYVAAPGSSRDVVLYSGEGGQAILERTSAKPNESVYLWVLPEDQAAFDFENYVLASAGLLFYLYQDPETGIHVYELIMPEEPVSIFVEYKITGPYGIDVEIQGGSGEVSLSAEEAWFLDTVTAEVVPDPGYYVLSVVAASHDGAMLTTLDQDGSSFSFAMPPDDVKLLVYFEGCSNGITITAGEGGIAYADRGQARTGETVNLTCIPDAGYELDTITGVEGLTITGENTYSFPMPAEAVNVNVTFRPKSCAVRVVMETTVGGSAFVDVPEARPGDEVTLICEPAEGYRVARITGVEELTDNGDGTYTFVMPGQAVELHVWILHEDNPFLDVQEPEFYYIPVLWAVEQGITNGVSATTFGHGNPCTRGQVVTFLWRAMGEPAPVSTEHPFTDVEEDKYYYEAMLWAVEQGITNGTSATTFGPDRPCTRGQVVTFLWRAWGEPAPIETEHLFTDVEEGDYYYEAMLWAVENEVTNGVSVSRFGPDRTCTRGQVVTFLYRVDQLGMEKPSPKPTNPTNPTEPSAPMDPTDPEPTDPTDPTDPTEPEPTHRWKVDTYYSTSDTEGDVTIKAGESFRLRLVCKDCDEIPTVEWVAETEGIVQIDGNRITGLAGGQSVWVSTEWEGVTYRCLIRVRPGETLPTEPTEPEPTDPEPTDPEPTEPEPTEPEHQHTWKLNKGSDDCLNEGEVSIDVGESFTLKILCRDPDCFEVPAVEWVPETEGIVQIDGNRITGLTGGQMVWVSAEWEGVTYRCLIRVRPGESQPTEPEPTVPEHTHQWKVDTYYSTSDTEGDVTIAVSESFRLHIVCKDEDCGKIADVTWTPDIEGVVAIDGDRITGITSGRKVVLTTEFEGVTYKCIVRVYSKTNQFPGFLLRN